MVVVLVVAKMICEMVDAFRDESDLYLGRACIALVCPVFGDYLRCSLHCAINLIG